MTRHILLADAEHALYQLFMQVPHITLHHATTSDQALQIAATYPLDWAFIDLYLYPLHGLGVLKKLKKSHPELPIIIISYEPMLQNYRACLDHGALDFIAKPLHLDTIKNLPSHPSSYQRQPFTPLIPTSDPFFLPEKLSETYIKFWGTRGSHAVSGSQYLHFGGNTSCLEIRDKEHLVIIDAGTGLANIGHELITQKKMAPIELLIGHTHLDHMVGLPSFAPLHDPRFSLTIRAPINFYKNTKDLLKDMLTHAFFPVDLEELKASVTFKELTTHTPFTIGSIDIDTHYTYHPGTALGFKIKLGSLSIGYITDNEALMGYSGDPKLITEDHPLLVSEKSFIEFFKGVDILIHEAQYTAHTYPEKIGWGHSSIYNAAILVKYINPKTWIITHHDPEETDLMLEEKQALIAEACQYLEIPSHIIMAYDGLKINF